MTDAGHYWIYFDIETTGIDPEHEKIVTIQYQPLFYDLDGRRQDLKTFESLSPELTVLKEWESDEKSILQKAYNDLEMDPGKHSGFHWFEPIGNILSFEGKFLKARMKHHGILGENGHLKFGQLNVMDLRPLMILINNGNYDTAKFFGKVGYNAHVPYWYKTKDYVKIENYVKEEAISFAKTLDYLVANLPKLKDPILSLHG